MKTNRPDYLDEYTDDELRSDWYAMPLAHLVNIFPLRGRLTVNQAEHLMLNTLFTNDNREPWTGAVLPASEIPALRRQRANTVYRHLAAQHRLGLLLFHEEDGTFERRPAPTQRRHLWEGFDDPDQANRDANERGYVDGSPELEAATARARERIRNSDPKLRAIDDLQRQIDMLRATK